MKRNELFKPILILFLAVLLIQSASGIALFAAKLGVAPDAIREFYLGSEEKFTRPRTMPGLLEVTVPHLAAIGVTLFILWHFLSIFASRRPPVQAVLPLLCFACAFGDLTGGYLIRYAHPGFVYFKMASFAVFEISYLTIIAIMLANILMPEKNIRNSPGCKPRL